MRRKESNGNPSPDLTLQAYEGIRQMILMNEIGKNQKFNFRELAQKLSMSRTPLMQALKCMEFQGLVRNEPNRGFYLNDLDLHELEEIYELRETVETTLLPRVMARLTPRRVQQLRDVFEEYFEASRKRRLRERLIKDMEFHLTLASFAERPIAVRFLRELLDRLYLRFEQESIFNRPPEIAENEHQAILEAVIDRDTGRACEALKGHLHSIRHSAIQSFWNRQTGKEAVYA